MNTYREGQRFFFTWNEPNLSRKYLLSVGARIEKAQLTPDYSCGVHFCVATKAKGSKRSVKLQVKLLKSSPSGTDVCWDGKSDLVFIYATMDETRQQLSFDKDGQTWIASWDDKVGKEASFELVIDFDPTENREEKSVPHQVMSKLLTNRILADVTFKFPGITYSNFLIM